MSCPWWIALLPLAAAPAAAQGNPFVGVRPQMKAASIARDGLAMHGRGHARVTVGPLVFESDEATVRLETGAAEMRGHARTTIPARADRHLIRCGSRAVVSEDPVLLAADRIDLKDGLLRARGHVRLETAENHLLADELDLYLDIGDGEARGNLRLNGGSPDAIRPRGRLERYWPPEIIR